MSKTELPNKYARYWAFSGNWSGSSVAWGPLKYLQLQAAF